MGVLSRLLLRLVLLVVARPRLTLGLAGVLLAASVALAVSRLGVSTDQNRLFSSDVPFFRDWLDFCAKFPENDALYVLIEPADSAPPPPVARWTGLADAITARLRGMRQVRSVDSRVPLDQLGRQAMLFEDAADLPRAYEEARRFVPLVRLWGEKPGVLAALAGRTPVERFLGGVSAQAAIQGAVQGAAGGEDAETAAFVGALARSWAAALARPGPADAPMRVGREIPDLKALDADDPSRLGYYYVPDASDPTRRLLLVRVYEAENETSADAQAAVIDAIRSAAEGEGRAFPEFKVGVTGRPALDADETRDSDRDARRSEVVALSAVFVGVAVMLRSLWLALAAEIALAVGIGWTFGYATLAVGELNLLSLVFLIALIGIGMDYLIQILTRYRQESARRRRPAGAWVAVFRHVAAPINTACLGAAGAFLVSVFTDFRGAAELGVIAGGGLLLCLLAGYTVLPALLVIFPPAAPSRAGRTEGVAGGVGRPGPSGAPPPARRLLGPVAWVALLALGVPFMRRYHFDPNLLNLQAQNLPSVQLVKKLQTWSAVVMSKDLDLLRRVRDTLTDAPTVASTESLLSAQDNAAWIARHAPDPPAIEWAEPDALRAGDLKNLADKARALADTWGSATGRDGEKFSTASLSLRNFAEALERPSSDAEAAASAARLTVWQAGFVGQLRGLIEQVSPGPLDVAKLPAEMRSHFVSGDGTYALYVNPREDLWGRESLDRFMRDVEGRVARVAGAPAVTGIASDIYHSTAAIEKAFYKATGYALGLIFVLVLIDLRRPGQTLLALSVLGLGLPMLVALMGLLGVSWNFANFFGLPILIGAGHEYGVFMVHRYREARLDPRRAWRGWDASDRALLLCAYVTSTSFGFFWALGHHEGLKSLGLVMALGTACIYLATVSVLRPVLLWKLRRPAEGSEGRPYAETRIPESPNQ